LFLESKIKSISAPYTAHISAPYTTHISAPYTAHISAPYTTHIRTYIMLLVVLRK